MKEKRLKDGKRDLRRWRLSADGEAPKGREDAWRPRHPGSLEKIGKGRKERRYLAGNGRTEYHVFDPETCLHVGKHDGIVGVVFRFRGDYWGFPWGDSRDYSGTSVTRGLVPWDGRGGEGAIRLAAAVVAARQANVARPPRWLVEKLCEPGVWGSREFWRKLVEAHGLAADIDTVKGVMES